MNSLRFESRERGEVDIRELLGRARLMEELLEDGVYLALPMGACDTDMLAYLGGGTPVGTLEAVPVKIVSSSFAALSNVLEGLSAPGLLIALVSGARNAERVRTFALTAAELTVLKMIEIIGRASPAQSGRTSDQGSSPEWLLQKALEPFAMSRGKWRTKIAAILEGQAA